VDAILTSRVTYITLNMKEETGYRQMEANLVLPLINWLHVCTRTGWLRVLDELKGRLCSAQPCANTLTQCLGQSGFLCLLLTVQTLRDRNNRRFLKEAQSLWKIMVEGMPQEV